MFHFITFILIWPRNAVIFALISQSSGLMGWVTRRHRTAETETREPEKKIFCRIHRADRERVNVGCFLPSLFLIASWVRASSTDREKRKKFLLSADLRASLGDLRDICERHTGRSWAKLICVNESKNYLKKKFSRKKSSWMWNVKCFAICRVSFARHNKRTCTEHRSVIIAEQGSRTSVVYKRKRKVNFTLIEILD